MQLPIINQGDSWPCNHIVFQMFAKHVQHSASPPIHHASMSSPLYLALSSCYIYIHIYLSMPSRSPPFPLCPVPSHPVCCSAAVWEQGQWWWDRWKDGGRPRKEGQGICWLLARQRERELRASTCPLAFQVGQTSRRSQFSQPQGESVCVYCVYWLLF